MKRNNIQEQYKETIRQLVNLGANSKDTLNEALQLAAKGGYTDIVKFFIEKGADVTAENNMAMWLAAGYGHVEVVNGVRIDI